MIETSNRTMVQIPGSALAGLQEALARATSRTDAAAALREAGLSAGTDLFSSLEEHMRGFEGQTLAGIESDRFWERFADFFEKLGWGTMQFERLHSGAALLSSADWAEAAPGAGFRQPSCHLTTGILAELLSRTAGTDIAVLEVECRSTGDSRCGFLLGNEEALGTVYAKIRDGERFTDAVNGLA